MTRNLIWCRKLVTRERRTEETNKKSDDDDSFFISNDDRGDDDDDNVNQPVRDELVQQRLKHTIRRPEKLRDYDYIT